LPAVALRHHSGADVRRAPDLLALADEFDVFVFDAFGVLNLGQSAIAGAPECIAELRARGKAVFVLTNGASAALSAMPMKFSRLGYDFSPDEIVSSRLAAEQAASHYDSTVAGDVLWGAVTGDGSSPDELPVNAIEVADQLADYDRVDAFIVLSAHSWNEQRQALFAESLRHNPRHIIIANPDVVAPHENGFSLEPGYYAHQLLDEMVIDVEFHGKPFPSVFALVRDRIEQRRVKGVLSGSPVSVIPGHRIVMLGDTLHTDVLGAKAAGWSAILVSDHGLFRGHDVNAFIDASGIVPDWIIPSI